MPQIDLKNCTLIIQDGTGTPNTVEVNIGDGNLTWNEKRDIQYKPNRGKLGTTYGGVVREGDQIPCEVSFEFIYDWIKAESGVEIVEALKQIGGASTWVSVGALCEPYAVTLVFKQNVTCGTTLDEVITFTEFRWDDLNYDVKNGMISCRGRCNNVAPTPLRTALT